MAVVGNFCLIILVIDLMAQLSEKIYIKVFGVLANFAHGDVILHAKSLALVAGLEPEKTEVRLNVRIHILIN